MSTVNATDARSKLYALIDETAKTHRPITITGKRGNAVLLAEEDWNAINETLYLVSIPAMRESIREGLEADLDECSEDLDWNCGRSTTPSKRRKMPGSWPRPALRARPRSY